MFNTDYFFDEVPLAIGTMEVACCSGVAHLEGEIGQHDYRFCVVGIELDGSTVGNYRDRRQISISLDDDDPLATQLFRCLARRIENDRDVVEHYYSELSDFRHNAA